MDTSVAETFDRMFDEMVPRLQQHVVAVLAFYDGRLHHHSTGCLVEFGESKFVVTAAHSVKDYASGKDHYTDLQLFIDNGTGNSLVPLYGEYLATLRAIDRRDPRASLQDDQIDIAVWELDPTTTSLLTSKRFLHRNDISITADLTAGVYLIGGIPCSWTQSDEDLKRTDLKWIRYISGPTNNTAALDNFDPNFHFALNRASFSEDVMPSDLRGISGSPIWKLADSLDVQDWSVDDVKVVAVQTCVYRSAIRGTKWRWVVSTIAELRPQLREVFKLWIPGPE